MIGKGETSAILGFEHNLLQTLSYDVVQVTEPAMIARAHIPPPQLSPDRLAEQFLFLSQNRDDKTNLGWGLRVEPSGCGILRSKRGFIDGERPTRLRRGWKDKSKISTNAHYVEKKTSYVKDGRLFQAMVVASREPGLPATWKLGGEIQLLTGESATISPVVDDECSFTYFTETSCENEVLTLTCKMTKTVGGKYEAGGERIETKICLDLTLFIDGKAEKFEAKPPKTTAVSADVSRSGELKLPNYQDSTSIVAVISLRNPEKVSKPELPQWPGVLQLRKDLMVGYKLVGPPVKPLARILKEKCPKLQLQEIPNIIACGVGRALSCLVDIRFDDNDYKLPIRNALHGYALSDIDVEECL